MNLAQNVILASTAAEKLNEGIITLVVGMGTVFVTLIVLVLILEASGRFFTSLDNKKKASAEPVEPVIVETVELMEQPADDLELVAVIAASIAASIGTTADNLQVRSIRKVNNSWSKMGRMERLYN